MKSTVFTAYHEDLDALAKHLKETNRTYFAGDWSEEDLGSYQLGRLREIAGCVKENSPFYAEHLSAWSTEGLRRLTFENLEEIPFTEKRHLREGMFDLLSKPLSEAWIFYETTGTTGPATPCPRTEVDSLHSNTALTFCYGKLLDQPGKDHVVGISGPTELHSYGDTFGDVCRNLGLPAAKMWPHSPVVGYSKALEVLRKLGVTVMMCTPGMALSLAKAARGLGLDLERDFALKKLLLTGELVSEALLENIGGLWGAEAHNFLYASQEATVLAAAADSGPMFTLPLNNYYEVIDPHTARPTVPDPEGTLEGELVVTMLFDGAKPLLRYRTGDLVRMYPPSTRDTMPSARMRVLGRQKDTLPLNGRNVAALDLEEALFSGLTRCLGYEIVVDNSDGVDEVTVRLEMLDPSDETSRLNSNITDAFKYAFGVPTTVSFEELDATGTTGAMVSWKAARIADRRSEEDVEKQAALAIALGRRES